MDQRPPTPRSNAPYEPRPSASTNVPETTAASPRGCCTNAVNVVRSSSESVTAVPPMSMISGGPSAIAPLLDDDVRSPTPVVSATSVVLLDPADGSAGAPSSRQPTIASTHAMHPRATSDQHATGKG